MNQRDQDDIERVADQEASQSSLDELDEDMGGDDKVGDTTPPGRDQVSDHADEPRPGKTIGVSDYPVGRRGTDSG